MAKGRTSAKRIINGQEYQFGSDGKIKEMLVEAIQSWGGCDDLQAFVTDDERFGKDFIEAYATPVEHVMPECLDYMTKLDAIAFILAH